MFKKTILDFKSSGTLNKLVRDYLEKNKNLQPFYSFFPDKNGFAELLKTNPYKDFNRALLPEILEQQGRLVGNTSENTFSSIARLKNKNTFTITTGHQLCLFTGPLYFIYKIFSAINLAEALKKEFPAFDFVPVYWMASEDHDFEEVASFNTNGKTLTWPSAQKGAVGDFKTAELKSMIPALREALGISENASYLLNLFEDAYLKNASLADSTRYLVNALFGEYGLVTVDGNDKAFKAQAKNLFRTDIFEDVIYNHVNEGIQKLDALGYGAQVNPRQINCFYLENGLRARLEKNGEAFNLVGTDRSFTSTELENMINDQPEKISPNVVLRPVYQQIILPNLAYIGGPGELAYWLEFKGMFDNLDVLFPILMPRNFISVLDKNTKHKIDKLSFSEAEFFKPEQTIIRDFMVKNNHVFDLETEKEKIVAFYADITSRATAIDPTLKGHVSAEMQRTLNKLDVISAKSNKALKRNSETELNRIKAVKQFLFPNNAPQERFENFSSFYLEYGPGFFKAIKSSIDPFVQAHNILTEE